MRDPLTARGEILACHEPAHMAPEKPVLACRMYVLRLIGMHMVMPMLRCPPQRATLYARGTDQGEDELRRARGAKRIVRKIAMVKAGDRKHAQRVEACGNDNGSRADTHPDDGEAPQMQRHKRQHARPIHATRGHAIGRSKRHIVIEPREQALPAAGLARYFFHCCGTFCTRVTS